MVMMMMMMTRCDGTVVVVQIVMGVPSTANRALPWRFFVIIFSIIKIILSIIKIIFSTVKIIITAFFLNIHSGLMVTTIAPSPLINIFVIIKSKWQFLLSYILFSQLNSIKVSNLDIYIKTKTDLKEVVKSPLLWHSLMSKSSIAQKHNCPSGQIVRKKYTTASCVVGNYINYGIDIDRL